MPNRSHSNPRHRAIHRLRRAGKRLASEPAPAPAPCSTTHRIVVGDVIAALAAVASGSARLVVCDPPYNLDLAPWDRPRNYLDWSAAWLTECQRILEPHGSMVLFGGLHFQNESGGDLLELMHYLRHHSPLRLVNLIVWNYPNGMSAQRFFASRHEEIAWYAKGPRYRFNLDAVREPYDAETFRRYARDPRLRPESVAKGKNPTNVWRIGRLNANARERTGHPTQKPRALIRRILLGLSAPGDLIVDPFAGSGVTARVAIELGRNSINIDRDSAWPGHLERQLRDLPPDVIPYQLGPPAQPAGRAA